MINIDDLTIDRITIHNVHQKTDSDEVHGFPEYTDDVFVFGEIELETLKKRIGAAFSKSKRFFKLEIEKSDRNSFYSYSKDMKGCSVDRFIELSKSICDLLAASHTKKTIPAGILMVIDGKVNLKHFVLVVKAELQEAFLIKETENSTKLIELVNELFLSPAKDFYKLGMVIEERNDNTAPNDLHSCFMYDDHFHSGSKDLAEYFYSNFLGFRTSTNDKLLTKNFYENTKSFINSNVVGFDDQRGLVKALDSFYREDVTGIVNPREFGETYFENDVLRLFETEVESKYPHSFTKDLTLVDRRLSRGQIFLANELKIEGPSDSIANVDILSKNIDANQLQLMLNNGDYTQIIAIRTDEVHN